MLQKPQNFNNIGQNAAALPTITAITLSPGVILRDMQ